MKSLLPVCLLAVVAAAQSSSAPTASSVAPLMLRVKGESPLAGQDLALWRRQFIAEIQEEPPSPLANQKWTWQAGQVEFGADGKARSVDGEWEGRGLVTSWRHLGRRNVLLKIEQGRDHQMIALLQFNKDWTAYTGWDFDGTAMPGGARVVE